MSSATYTLIGLTNYLEYWDKDLFMYLTLPEGIDKQTCIDNILLTAGDNELLYPNGDFMIDAINMWSKKWYRTFEKWISVLSEEYEPLENYDRKEAWSDSFSESTSESSSASASDSSSTSNSMLDTVSAFNSSNLENDSASNGNNVASSRSHSNGINESKHGSIDLHRGRVHGNIGVTTTQQMLQQELEVQRFNIYDEIAIIFVREFTLAL